jgi:hypothetical protein
MKHAIIEQSNGIFLLFHPGSTAVSSNAVDPRLNRGYRLFTISLFQDLGETAPEKLAYSSTGAISLSILRNYYC